MKKIIRLIALITLAGTPFTSCRDMDIPPVNIVTNQDVFTSVSGIESYMAKMYMDLPFDDFHSSPSKGYKTTGATSFGGWAGLTGEAIARSQNSQSALAWFTQGYAMLRDVNTFIETLPQYASNFTEAQVRNWLGEAHFIRGFVYFSMVKRHGGVILVNEVLHYPGTDIAEFQLPRSSEEDSWDQVSADFQYAIDRMDPTGPRGRANKYVAAAYKARAMIFAASVARYNQIAVYDTERQIRLCGIPSERAVDYYRQAYLAARMLDGKYGLYMGDWKADDKQAQYINFQNIFQKPDNIESVYVKEYSYPVFTHSWDCIYGPLQMKVENVVGGIQPTLDFVEMFDGLDKNPDGSMRFMDAQGHYILYDHLMDPFRNAEPRLRATVLFPGDDFKGEMIEVWRGIYTQPAGAGITKLFPETSTAKYNTHARLATPTKQEMIDNYTLPSGKIMPLGGGSGSFNSTGYGTTTGFILRKWLDTSLPKGQNIPKRSESDWIDMRYAEVLLTKAEAAFELDALGDTQSPTYLSEAYDAIQAVRLRAGATLLGSPAELTREVIRRELRKELGMEQKTFWDLTRWRVFHLEQSSKRRYFNGMPFFAAHEEKWFYDRKYCETSTNSFTFNPKWYYVTIPSSEINKNPNIVPNP